MEGTIIDITQDLTLKKETVVGSIKKNLFKIQEAIYYENDYKTEIIREIITKNDMPLTIVNKWLSLIGQNSKGTNQGYAYKLKRYLEFIDKFGMDICQVTNSQMIIKFLNKIMHENPKKNLAYTEIQIGYNTISTYAVIIKEFYLWLDEMFNVQNVIIKPDITYQMQKYYEIKKKKSKKKTNYKNESNIIKFDYYNIWVADFMEELGIKRSGCKNNKVEHIKWYSEEDIEIIKTNFNTKRDLAIYCLGLQGARIEEILTIKKEDYISTQQKVFISQSKTMLRWIFLPLDVCKIIESYLYTERDVVENEMDFMGVEPYLFINLKNTRFKGKKVQQGNYRRILKIAGKKAGFNPEEIITHAGRSTKTQQMIKQGANNEQIRNVLGWNNEKSIESYRKKFDNDIALSASQDINKRGRVD